MAEALLLGILVTLPGAIVVALKWGSVLGSVLTAFGGRWQVDEGVDRRPAGVIGQVEHGLQHQAAGGVGHVHPGLLYSPLLVTMHINGYRNNHKSLATRVGYYLRPSLWASYDGLLVLIKSFRP